MWMPDGLSERPACPEIQRVGQSVEETVKGLVDDGMIHIEKVGTVNLYWSFASESSLAISRALQALRSERHQLEQERCSLQMALEKSAADRLVNEMREKNLREIKVLKQDIADMKAKLSHYSKNDPKFLEEQMKLRNLYKSGAEIWTENLTLMMSYCRDEYQIDRQKFCAQFDLPEDFEEIPESADG